jgi:hypothetical protein
VKVHITGLTSPEQFNLIRLFEERGCAVSHSEQVPSDAALYLFCTGHEAMKHLTHGLVVLDLRWNPIPEMAAWTHFADLCLVRDAAAQTSLVDISGSEPDRVFLVPDNRTLFDLVDRALRDALPPAAVRNRGEAMANLPPRIERVPPSPAQRFVTLSARLEATARQADVMFRDYQVRSKVPIIGPFIAWTRRNLTSHLREPYLDPTLERQVTLNHDLVVALREMMQLLADLEERLVRLEEKRG